MKNLRELFNLYHDGFQDFGPWLDVPEFSAEWLRRWEAVGRLLGARALIEIVVGNGYHAKYEMTLGGAIKWGRTQRGKTRRVCVALFDGTIIREWGPK